MSTHVWVLDDDKRIGRLVSHLLTREGYLVRTTTTAAELRSLLVHDQPQLFILDLMLPDDDGLSLARELRTRCDVPIIMLTGKADVVDRVVGLEVGADDYITKPFDERELLARVRAVLRRPHGTPPASVDDDSVVSFSGWQMDLDAHELTDPHGNAVRLTSYEFTVLSALVKHAGRVVTRDEILDLAANRQWSPYDRSVDVLIGKLRKKLEPDPRNPIFIKTMRGLGYKFVAKVSSASRNDSRP